MFTIGEFSKVTGLTVKTLRFYHEEGLLEPTCVDEESGYRYYDASKIEGARVISFLRSLEFPVAEIRELLRGSEADLTAALERQRKVIEERIRKLKQVAQSLDQFLSCQRELKMLTAKKSEFVCEEKIVGPMLIAAVRMQAPYPECGQGFSKIGKQFWNQICGPAMLLCYDQEYQEIADFEACMPIKSGKPVAGIDVRELSGGRCISLLHKGPYTELSRSYQKIMTFCKEQGHKITVPCREVYLKGPGMFFKGNPKNYLTELQMIVEE